MSESFDGQMLGQLNQLNNESIDDINHREAPKAMKSEYAQY